MLTQNILDDSHPEATQFTDCKIKYLLAENKIMNVQLGFVSALIEKYKKIIDILSQQDRQSDEQLLEQGPKPTPSQKPQITQLLQQTQTLIQTHTIQCQALTSPTTLSIFHEDQATITPAFFSELVLSYEKTISELKHSIHQRQILLQQLENTPQHPMKRQGCDFGDSSAVVKAIQSYDVYPKISEKCRREILELKQKKKQLQLANSAKYTNSNISRKMSTVSTNQSEKTVRKVPQYATNMSSTGLEDKTQIQIESMSPFEKTILIYKKKKIFNEILESKVLDLKKKIKQKQQSNQLLKKRLENQVWENIENINKFGQNLDEDDPAYLSILNQSIRANNLDFSVDISRVIPGFINKDKDKDEIQNNVNLENILQEVNREKQPIIKS